MAQQPVGAVLALADGDGGPGDAPALEVGVPVQLCLNLLPPLGLRKPLDACQHTQLQLSKGYEFRNSSNSLQTPIPMALVRI